MYIKYLFCLLLHMKCNKPFNKCSSSWKAVGSVTNITAVSLVWLSVPFTKKKQNFHREPICFSCLGINQSCSSMGPREAMLRPQKRAKKSPVLIRAGSCLVIYIRDLSSAVRRLRGSKIRGMIQMWFVRAFDSFVSLSLWGVNVWAMNLNIFIYARGH